MPVASSVRNQMMRLFRKGNKKGKTLVNKENQPSTGSTSINGANSCYSELSEDNSSQIFKRSKSRRGSKLFRSIRKRFSRSKSYLQAAVTSTNTPHHHYHHAGGGAGGPTHKLGESSSSVGVGASSSSAAAVVGVGLSKGSNLEDECDCQLSRRISGGEFSAVAVTPRKSSGAINDRGSGRIRRRNSKRENRNSCPPPLRQIIDDEESHGGYSYNSGDSECGDGKALLLVPGGGGSSSQSRLSTRGVVDMKKDISPVVVVVEPPAEYCDPQQTRISSEQTAGVGGVVVVSPTSSDQGKSLVDNCKLKEAGSGNGGQTTTTPVSAVTPGGGNGGGGGAEPSSASSSRRPSVEMSGAPRAELSVHGPNSSSSTRGSSAGGGGSGPGGGGSGRKGDGATTVTDGASVSKKSDGPGRPPSGSASGPRQVDRNFGNVRRGGGRKVSIKNQSFGFVVTIALLST